MPHNEGVVFPGRDVLVRALDLRVPSLVLALVLGLGLCTVLSAQSEPVPRTRVTDHSQAPFPYGEPTALGFTEGTFERLGDQVESWVGAGTIVGAEVLVVKEGQIAWHEVFGVRDLETGEPLAPAGAFRIRSMTKPFLGTAALRLVERGELSLDDAVSRYLPAQDAERWREVTVRRLLEHTSGLAFSPFPRDRSSYADLRESVEDLPETEPSGPAGEFVYSDAGSATLGAVLEAASGQPLESLLAREVFEPLGLRDTHTAYDPEVPWRPRMNSTHYWDVDDQAYHRYWHPGEAQEMVYFRASGGAYSTVFDYARFLHHWQRVAAGESGGLVSPELARRALRQVTEVTYGWHWETVEVDGGIRLFGHGGSDGTLALSIPAQDLLVLYFTQSRGQSCRDQFSMLAGMTGELGALGEYASLGHWRDRNPAIEPVDLGPEDRSRYVGWYDVRGTTVEIRSEGTRLKLVRGLEHPRPAGPSGANAPGAIACTPSLAVPLASVDLIPLGEDRFALGKLEEGRVVEHYWPGRDLVFQVSEGEVVGYELEYDAQVVERGRSYRWQIARAAPKRETVPEPLRSAIGGTYESGLIGRVEVEPLEDRVELYFGGDPEIALYQGAGYFLGSGGEIVTFGPDPESGLWRLRVLETEGWAYEFERPEPSDISD